MKAAFRLGQLRVEFEGETAVVHGPSRDSVEVEIDAREELVRDWVRHDESGRYRPLPGANDMRGGWKLRCSVALPLETVAEIVYPLATLHIEEHREGVLRLVPLQDVLQRQTGRYGRAVTLPEEAREVAVEVLCGRCVKRPVWHGAEAAGEEIPCPEACSVMVSLCRDAALWELASPPGGKVDEGLPWAAFERPGNEIREEYLRQRFGSGDQVGLSDE